MLAEASGESAGANHVTDVALRFGVAWQLLTSQVVCFLLVAAVLYKFAYKPILTLLEERRRTIQESLENAEKVKVELEGARKKAEEILADAGEQARKFLEEARAASERLQTEKAQEATRRAGQAVGRAIVVTSAMLAAGFAVMALSSFATLREFGLLFALTVGLCVAADLLLLPALLMRLRV